MNHSPTPRSVAGAIWAAMRVFLYGMLIYISQTWVITGMVTRSAMGGGLKISLEEPSTLMQPVIDLVMQNITMITLISNLLTVLILCLLFHFRRKNPAREMGIRPTPVKWLPWCAVLGTAMNIFVSVTMGFLPEDSFLVEAQIEQYAPMFEGENLLLQILAIAVSAGIVEELIFRGIAMKRLLPAASPTAAVVLSAVIFSLFHGTPLAIAYSFLLGVMLAMVYRASGSSVQGIVIHVFFNLTSFWITSCSGVPLVILYLISLPVAVVSFTVLLRQRKRTAPTDGMQ